MDHKTRHKCLEMYIYLLMESSFIQLSGYVWFVMVQLFEYLKSGGSKLG